MKKEYILITPVHNEEELIGQAIESVIAQTVLPKKWLIVDDGSTDETANIIKQYEAQYDFMTSFCLSHTEIESYYGQRTRVVLAGYEKIKHMEHAFVGVLDADITLQPTYYEDLLDEFDRNPQLGIAAGVFLYKINDCLKKPLMDKSCTSGSNQVFRRDCYEEIGGYTPLKHGGDDSLVDILARMHGWKTQSFEKCPVIQHRAVGTGDGRSILKARFRQGLTDYGIATHPVFMLAKCFRRVFLEKPFFTGGLARMAGFLYGYCLNEERTIPPAAIDFVRREQIKRLFSYLSKH